MVETLVIMGRVPGTTGHVTFAFKANCTGGDRYAFILEMSSTFKDLFPLECRINPELIKVGKQRELDAYQITLVNKETAATLENFWNTQQRRASDQEMFPFNLHVTLNSEEKRKGMEGLLEKGGTFEITEIFMRTLVTKEIVVEMIHHK